MIKRYTPKEVLRLRPCFEYSKDRVKTLWGKRAALSARQIANLDIPHDDILWVLIKLLPEKLQHEAACQFAEPVLHLFESKYPNDNRPSMAIETKRAWLNGNATDEDLAAAWAAAGDAAGDAAWVAEKEKQIKILLKLHKEVK